MTWGEVLYEDIDRSATKLVVGEGDRFELRVDVELGQDRADLGSDGGDGDDEIGGYVLGVVALGEKVEHFSFSRAVVGRGIGRSSRCCAW